MVHPQRINLNPGWTFRFENEPSEPVTLPHSWNALDTMAIDPARHYRRGTGIYTCQLNPALTGQERLWLEIEAASQKAKVFLNGQPIGIHQGGYTAFTLELTPHRYGLPDHEALTLQIEVDNAPDPDLIPSDMSDFFLYGGLTRNVWLYRTGATRIEYLHVVPELHENTANIYLKGQFSDPLHTTAVITLTDPQGRHSTYPVSINGTTFELPLTTLTEPLRWSPATPYLYHLRLELPEQGDTLETRFGLRAFEFPAGGPFFLNGERLLLRGTHRHEDWAGCGSAVPDVYSRRELEQIRAAGFNFIRLGHYPQAPAVLDACDELGLLVWEELPWCRGGLGGAIFQQQARTMLQEMIEQHYNHPSIIFWGLGNELDWESEHPDSTDAKVAAFLAELHALSHNLDPSRLTALRRFEPGAALVDVYSPSIWSGWYRGRYQDYEVVLAEAMARYPRFFHAEWGGDSHVGRHRAGNHISRDIATSTDHAEVPGLALSQTGEARASRDSDWSESYMLDVMEWHLQVQARLLNLAGTAQWIFSDFGTPLRPENPIPYINQKGLVDRAGRPKDLYYLFQSYQTDTPVCYIESPTWAIREADENQPQRVRVYSNCGQVELLVNGQSQGIKQRDPGVFPAAGLCWQVILPVGKNTLHAIGYHASGAIPEHCIQQEVVNLDAPVAVSVSSQTGAAMTPDGQPATQVTLQLINAGQQPVTAPEQFLQFSTTDGKLWINQGTPDGSQRIQTANGRAVVYMLTGSRLHIQAETFEQTIDL